MSNIKFTISCLALGFFSLSNCAPPFEALHSSFSGPESQSAQSGSGADLYQSFEVTLKPVLRNNCAVCHGQGQRPEFALEDSTSAVNTIMDMALVDFDAPRSSRFVQKIQGGHNGFPLAVADELALGIENWASAMLETPPEAPPVVTPPVVTPPMSPPVMNPPVTPPQDTEAPTVMINSPTEAAMLKGTVEIRAIANDNVQVSQVSFYLDGQMLGSAVRQAPYNLRFDTTQATNGNHLLKAVATDSSGNKGESVVVGVSVDNSTPMPPPPVQVNKASFKWVYDNVLVPRCINCHGSSRSSAGVRYDSYSATIRTVRAGNAGSSAFYSEINSGSMPIGGSKLSSEQIQAVRDWINAGALNN